MNLSSPRLYLPECWVHRLAPPQRDWHKKQGRGWSLRLSRTWLPEDRQVGPPIGQFCVAEHHNAVLSSFVEAKHSLLVIFDDGVYPRDHLIFALVVAGLVVRFPLVK